MKQKKIILFALFFLLGSLVTYQIRLLLDGGVYVHLEEIDYLQKQVANAEFEITQVKQQIEALKEQIKVVEEGGTLDDAYVTQLQNDIEKYRVYSGIADLEGEGILMIINDSENPLVENQDPSELIVHDNDLFMVVDALKNAGAEAISINGTRVVLGLTRIVCNGPTIRINGTLQGQPYIIRAIGDRYQLESAVMAPDKIGGVLKRFGLQVEVNTKTHMVIEGYKGRNWFKYAQTKE